MTDSIANRKTSKRRLDGVVIRLCDCGKAPSLTEISEWPAQYEVVCECGKRALGHYYAYASDNGSFRHRMSKASAVASWNERDFEEADNGALSNGGEAQPK